MPRLPIRFGRCLATSDLRGIGCFFLHLAFLGVSVVGLNGCGKRDPAPSAVTSTSTLVSTGAPSSSPSALASNTFLEVAPDEWKVRPSTATEPKAPPVRAWETVAFELVVPTTGHLRVSVVNRLPATQLLPPALAVQDEHHVRDEILFVHPGRIIYVRLSFETWRGSAPILPKWVTEASPDAGVATAGVMYLVMDDLKINMPGERIETRSPIFVDAAPKVAFNKSRTTFGGLETRKIGGEVALARWVWSPQMQPAGVVDALTRTAGITNNGTSWVGPEQYAYPTWLLRVSFTKAEVHTISR